MDEEVLKIIEKAPEAGFSAAWLQVKCKDQNIKLPRPLPPYLYDLGLVKTRSLWHAPRISTWRS